MANESRAGKAFAIILAAGRSERFGRDKLAVPIGEKPVWKLAYEAFLDHPEVAGVGIVTAANRVFEIRNQVPYAAFVVAGGGNRTESARMGLRHVPADAQVVLIHDGARPFVSPEVITRVIAAVRAHGAAFPAIAVTDTIRQKEGENMSTLDRATLLSVQTPQGATLEHWKRAFAQNLATSDDIALLEAIGVKPAVVEGDPRNSKITHASDLPTMWESRTGLGYDIHSFSTDPNRPLWLGGVEFDDRPGLEGHSDADVIIHALVDALLGGAVLGDIGIHYPNTDPQWKNAPSSQFLTDAALLLKKENWHIMHIDISVLAERPKIMVRKDEIRAALAQASGVSMDKISIKATTNERLGSIGRGEGIAAFAVATIARPTHGG